MNPFKPQRPKDGAGTDRHTRRNRQRQSAASRHASAEIAFRVAEGSTIPVAPARPPPRFPEARLGHSRHCTWATSAPDTTTAVGIKRAGSPVMPSFSAHRSSHNEPPCATTPNTLPAQSPSPSASLTLNPKYTHCQPAHRPGNTQRHTAVFRARHNGTLRRAPPPARAL